LETRKYLQGTGELLGFERFAEAAILDHLDEQIVDRLEVISL
jgi:hypothetical protein